MTRGQMVLLATRGVLPDGYVERDEEYIPTLAPEELGNGGELMFLSTEQWLDREDQDFKTLHHFQLLNYRASFRFSLRGSPSLDRKLKIVAARETVFLRYEGPMPHPERSWELTPEFTVARAHNGNPTAPPLMLRPTLFERPARVSHESLHAAVD